MSVNKDVTVCIKAFERPDCLKRAVESVRDFYPDVKIIVADDSERPLQLDGVETLILPFDTGLSFGRNRMVEHVKTKYMFLMEDDAYFCEDTDLNKLLSLMERTDVDILGLTMVDMPEEIAHHSGYRVYLRGPRGYSVPGYHVEEHGCQIHDLVNNIFMAKTRRLRWFKGWDEQLKICEHRDFFLRAKGRLKVACHPDLRILHNHIEDERYQSFRRGPRQLYFWKLFCKKHDIVRWENNLPALKRWGER